MGSKKYRTRNLVVELARLYAGQVTVPALAYSASRALGCTVPSKDVRRWVDCAGIEVAPSTPGRPQQLSMTECRALLNMTEYLDLTHTEICLRTGLDGGTLSSALKRAREERAQQ